MQKESWRLAAQQLKEDTSTASDKQKNIAKLAGITLSRHTPRLVAAAQLRLALVKDLHLKVRLDEQEHSRSVIEELWQGARKAPTPTVEEEAKAWIEHLFMLKRREAILKLRPEPGDVVATRNGDQVELSSIGLNGRLYFTGGNGRSAWPDNVTIICRAEDTSTAAKNARRAAENAASLIGKAREWTWARAEDLRDYRVTNDPAESDLLSLEAVIEAAKDERPIQEFLQQHPAILTLLVQRRECYVMPLKRLGAEYVPDFVVGYSDSIGMQWHLVELESPNVPMFTKDGKSFGKEARTGINQITHWRDWLDSNVAYARRPLSGNDGLGLFDIRNDAPGVVLVGRKATLTNKNEALRNQERAKHTLVHTYDWLLESLRSSLDFAGPVAANPYIISR